MAVDLFRVRFQELWGEQFGDFLDVVVTSSELEETVRSFAVKWFPDGCEVTQDPDSPLVWRVEELTDPKRVLMFFVESIGGIDE